MNDYRRLDSIVPVSYTHLGEMGEEVGSYQNSFTNDNNPQTITLSTTTAGTYYLHVLTCLLYTSRCV